MIIVELQGGLGNQMFEYAVGRRIASERNTPLLLDLTWFATQELRTYRLQYFNIQANIAEPALVEQFKSRDTLPRLRRGVRKLLGRRFRYRMLRENRDSRFHYEPQTISATGHLYLRGYFQHPAYFELIAETIRSDFTVKTAPIGANATTLKSIQATNAVSLHIRRGDFVKDEVTRRQHGILPLSYYEEALERISQQVNNPHFFIFSDDPKWVQDTLKLTHPMSVVDHNDAATDYEDLRLMAQCQHHIIANSSFSWWGAWLNPNPQKIVIAPSRWLAGDPIDTAGLIPANWQILAINEPPL